MFVYCRVYASVERLLIEADNEDLEMLCDRDRLREADKAKNLILQEEGLKFDPPADSIIVPGTVLNDLTIPPLPATKWHHSLDPYGYVHAPYNVPTNSVEYAVNQLYYRYKHTNCVLSGIQGLVMLVNIIENEEDGAGISLDQIQKHGLITNYFCTHDPRKAALAREWYQWKTWPWQQPIDKIRSYFGEKVAMYFAFVGLYTTWLFWPALLGLALFLHQATSTNIAVVWMPIYGILVAIWITFFLEFWKREQSFIAVKWGMSKFEEGETLRPEYVSNKLVERARSYVDGKPVFWDSPIKFLGRVSLSTAMVTMCSGIAIVICLAIFSLRIVLTTQPNLNPTLGGIIASVVNALNIQILNDLYLRMAVWFTNWENHRTDTEYEDSLIAKVCVFQSINSYMVLFYVAFVKGKYRVFGQIQSCDGGDCLGELRTQLAVIFITRLVVGNLTEILIPLIKRKINTGFTKKQHEKHEQKSDTEIEALLTTYDTFNDYLKMLIQFGYVCLFVVAFPLAPLLALLNNYIALRADCFKVLHFTARAIPRGAQDIGSWYVFLEVLGYAAIFTNLGVIVFTGQHKFFEIEAGLKKLIAFVAVEHAVFFIKIVGRYVIPDQSTRTATQLQRQEYLVNKHFRLVKDEVPQMGRLAEDDVIANVTPGFGIGGNPYDVLSSEPLAIKNSRYVDSLWLSKQNQQHLTKKQKTETVASKIHGREAEDK